MKIGFAKNKTDMAFDFMRGYTIGLVVTRGYSIDVDTYPAFFAGLMCAKADRDGKRWPVSMLPTRHAPPITEYMRGYILGNQMATAGTYMWPMCPSCLNAVQMGLAEGVTALRMELEDYLDNGGWLH